MTVTDDIKIAVGDLAALCYEISTETGNDVFFDYMPHISRVEVQVFNGKWYPGSNDCKTYGCYLDRPDISENTIVEIYEALNALKRGE